MEQDDELAGWKSKTYQRIGRNVLLFQQMEQLLKFILPRATLSIRAGADVRVAMDRSCGMVEKSTLGALVTQFIDEVYDSEEPAPGDPGDGGLLETRCRVEFASGEAREAMIARLADLVEGRNRLVHHFLARIESDSVESWRTADEELEKQHGEALAAIETLRRLLEALDTMRAAIANSDIRRELVVGPLREQLTETLRVAAAKSTDPDGWTSLGAVLQSDCPLSSDAIKEVLAVYQVATLSTFLETLDDFEIRHERVPTGKWRTFYRIASAVSADRA